MALLRSLSRSTTRELILFAADESSGVVVWWLIPISSGELTCSQLAGARSGVGSCKISHMPMSLGV